MPKLQVMDIRSYGGRKRASNRMIFLERGADCNALDFEYGERAQMYDSGTGTAMVYWVRRKYDPSTVNRAWRRVKGEGNVGFKRLKFGPLPKSSGFNEEEGGMGDESAGDDDADNAAEVDEAEQGTSDHGGSSENTASENTEG